MATADITIGEYESRLDLHDSEIASLKARLDALETPPPPPPPPDPEPDVVTGEQRLRETFGFRVPFPVDVNAATFIDQLGRVPAYFRWVIDHDSPGMFDESTGSAWQYYPPKERDGQIGMAHRWPTMATSTIFPSITGPKGAGMTTAERIKRHNEVIAGSHDAKINQILDYVSQGPPHVHRFCVNSEAELPNWAYRKQDIPPDVWRNSFHHVAEWIRERGHLVVYAGNGPFLNTFNGTPWWQIGMPDPDTFDIFGCDVYWGEGINPQTRLHQIDVVQQIAYDLGKPVAYPEYGVRANVTDDQKIGWLEDVWDLFASFPTSGPGSLDHHCLWDDDQSKLSPAVRAAVIERFA